MPDRIVARPGFRQDYLAVRYVDMLDTTWAEKIVVVNPDGTPIAGGGGGGGMTDAEFTAHLPLQTDPIDRAARLVGVVYGDVGQLAQRATTRDALVQLRHGGAEIDPRSIRTLTVADVVTAAQGARGAVGNAWPIKVVGADDTTVAPVLTATPAGTEAGMYVHVVTMPAGGGGGGVAQTQVRDAGGAWDDVGRQAADSRMPVDVWVGAAAIDPRDVSDRAGRALGVVASVTAVVNVADNGGSLTIDNANLDVALSTRLKPADTLAAVTTVTSLTQMNGQAIQMGTGARTAGTQRVTIATDDVVPVTGTFFQATQPVSIAAAVDVSDRAARLVGVVYGSQAQQLKQTASNFNAQVEVAVGATLIDPRSIRALTTADAVNVGQWIGSAAPTVGTKTSANSLPVVLASDQATLNVAMGAASVLFRGSTSSFRTPGRAGTAGQKVLAIYNAAGSGRVVTVWRLWVDLAVTVIKAITVLPPNIKIWKFTAAPTNGTALTKNKVGGTTTSHANVTVTGDASADGTGSGTTLTVTLPAGTFIRNVYAPRFVSNVGYEPMDREVFDFQFGIELQTGEGLCVFLDYVLATQNPTTDMWITGAEWQEV